MECLVGVVNFELSGMINRESPRMFYFALVSMINRESPRMFDFALVSMFKCELLRMFLPRICANGANPSGAGEVCANEYYHEGHGGFTEDTKN